MNRAWPCLLLAMTACAEIRVDRDDEPQPPNGEGEDVATPARRDAGRDRSPRACDVGTPIVQETFRKGDWPAAWLKSGVGDSWVDGGVGLLQASPASSHGRTIYAAFGDIDVAVRWQPSGEQDFRLKLRGDVENLPATIVEGHGVGSPLRAQWLRARIWSELGTTRLEVHEWFDGDLEPEGWLRTVVESAGPVGTFSLLAIERAGTQPVRVEEVLICPLVVGSDV